MSSDEPQFASAAAVAGLAREVEQVRLAVAKLDQLPSRVEELARLMARLAETAAAQARRELPAVPLWLALEPDQHDADCGQVEADVVLELTGLTVWMGGVYLRYADAARTLPACWLWHVEVIEELLWLRAAWYAAYTGETASVTAVGDWHDRQRPGVVRRIREYAGVCSVENHQTPVRAPAVPLGSAAAGIARWWASHRDALAPVPTPDQVSEAADYAQLRSRGGSRGRS